MAVMYTTDEQGNSISAYHISASGTVSAFQTISTPPDDFDRSKNSTSQLRVHPSGRFLYAPNRGHDSVACFSIDENSGELSLIGRVPTEDHVRGIEVEPQGRFFFAAGAVSGKMSAYRIDQDSGELTDRVIYAVGKAPMWVLAVELGG
jgi:6-phosphogluconolactonase